MEVEELKALNKDISNHLKDCKSEVKNYQSFLELTNEIIKDLNAPEKAEYMESPLPSQRDTSRSRSKVGKISRTTNFKLESPRNELQRTELAEQP